MKLTIVFCLQMIAIQAFELVNYTKEPYALIQLETAFLYDETEILLHVFNTTNLIDKFHKYKEKAEKDTYQNPRIKLLLKKCESQIDQLITHRGKRSIDFLGSVIKFVAGNPDHGDLIEIQKRINDLVENNNRINIILSDKFKNINGEYIDMEYLIELMDHELSQILYTINLAKAGILNTSILNLDEVRAIIKKEVSFDAPLMELLEHATVKVVQINATYVVMIKYPKITQKCMIYAIRSIETEFGKLELEKSAANCNETYITVKDCRKYVGSNICKTQAHTCTEELINGINTNCTMIREHMLPIEEIDDGRVLMHGTHDVNNFTKIGTYLALFNDSIRIDGHTYINDGTYVSRYLRSNRPVEFGILDIVDGQNENLRMKGLTIIEKIPIEVETHPIRTFFILTAAIIIIIYSVKYGFKAWKMYSWRADRRQRDRSNELMRNLIATKLGTISINGGESYEMTIS